jgi:hypothetical protein
VLVIKEHQYVTLSYHQLPLVLEEETQPTPWAGTSETTDAK